MKKLLYTLFAVLLFISTRSFSQSVTVTSPNGGESWAGCSTHNITWTLSDTATQVGYYQVQVINAAGCSSISDSAHISKIIGVGLNDLTITAPRIYPNPFENDLMIEWPSEVKDKSNLKWQLLNIHGQVIREGSAENNKEALSLFELNAGTYVLKIAYKEIQWQYPLVKQ